MANAKVYIICLAAGKGSRFGSDKDNKLLCDLDGKILAAYAIDAAIEAVNKVNVDARVIIVTRFEELEAKYSNRATVTVTNCTESLKGISYTIRHGIKTAESLDVDDNTFLIFLACDQPYIKSATIAALITNTLREYETTDEKGRINPFPIGAITCNNEMCNPVMFHRSYIDELNALEGDIGGKRVARSHEACVVPTPATPKEVIDIDYLSDLSDVK